MADKSIRPMTSRGHDTGASTASSTDGSSVSDNRPAVDLTVISASDDFVLELGEALAGQSIRPVDSTVTAVEFLASTKRGQVLVVDARHVSNVRGDVDLLHAQAPHAVVLVFATADIQKQIIPALKGSSVFAVMPIPIDRRKTLAVLEVAMADAIARKVMEQHAFTDMGVETDLRLRRIVGYFNLDYEQAKIMSVRLAAFLVDALENGQRLILRDTQGKDREVVIEKAVAEGNNEPGEDGE
jgi:hypothetical protein